MAFTYSGDPSASKSDAVRFIIGDTISTEAWFQDAEIAYFLTLTGNNVYQSAAKAARQIATVIARREEITTGVVRTRNAQKAVDYLALADTLEREDIKTGAAPYAGGISIADKETVEDDTDRVQPSFTRKMFVQHGDRTGSTDVSIVQESDG